MILLRMRPYRRMKKIENGKENYYFQEKFRTKNFFCLKFKKFQRKFFNFFIKTFAFLFNFHSFGGFLMMDDSGLIVLKNTLDVRVDLVYQDSLPDSRALLFPTNSKI